MGINTRRHTSDSGHPNLESRSFNTELRKVVRQIDKSKEEIDQNLKKLLISITPKPNAELRIDHELFIYSTSNLVTNFGKIKDLTSEKNSVFFKSKEVAEELSNVSYMLERGMLLLSTPKGTLFTQRFQRNARQLNTNLAKFYEKSGELVTYEVRPDYLSEIKQALVPALKKSGNWILDGFTPKNGIVMIFNPFGFSYFYKDPDDKSS